MLNRRTMSIVLAFLASAALAHAQAEPPKSTYPSVAPVSQYLIADRAAEIALARGAAAARSFLPSTS